MANLQINLLPEVAEVYAVESDVRNPIVTIAGISGEINLTSISLARVKELLPLGLSKVLKNKSLKTEPKAIETK